MSVASGPRNTDGTELAGGYVIRPRRPTLAEYRQICRAAGLSPVSDAQAAAGLARSPFAVCVDDGDRLVAMGRVVGDGGISFNIVDVAVHPEHRRRGLGAPVVTRLLDYVRERADRTSFVELFAVNGSEAFYRRFGFTRRPANEPSMILKLGA